VSAQSSVIVSPVFDTYWRFAAERQNIFYRRARGAQAPWTSDSILRRFRFTNAYRVADRVSQFLVRHVQGKGPQDGNSLFFRTILFKLFNRIETWQLLESAVGQICPESYDFRVFDQVLSDVMSQGRPIYSAAYIMPSGGGEGTRKHQMHLRLLETMMKNALPARLAESRSMQQAFELIRAYPTIGDFLAYQYVTDLNYSMLLDFSEMDFVVPGPGARSGLQKCFADRGSLSEADLIRWMVDHQQEEFSKRGIEFQSLWGRPLQLIDCQNLFCEVDKYARVHHPDVLGLSSRVRIKQEYRHNPEPLEYWLPPKWALNGRIAAWREGQFSTSQVSSARTHATRPA
jgi:alpha-glutamyl/putrescinyl thymine pyrophosphorylase clade 1